MVGATLSQYEEEIANIQSKFLSYQNELRKIGPVMRALEKEVKKFMK